MSLQSFLDALPVTLFPLLQIFAIGLIGAALAWTKIVGQRDIDTLARVTVMVLLPSLIFTKIVGGFRPGSPEYANWHILPLAAIGTVIVLFTLNWIPARLLCPPERRSPFRLLATFQNGGYFPLIIVAGIYGKDPQMASVYERLLVLIFLYVLGFSPLLWGAGVWVSRNTHAPGSDGAIKNGVGGGIWALIKGVFSPPLVACVSGIVLCLAQVPQSMPDETLEALLYPLRMVADCTVPIVILFFGAMLGSQHFRDTPNKREVAAAAGIRIVLMPALGFVILAPLAESGALAPAVALVLFIESMTPTATNLAVMARHYGSEKASNFVNFTIFVMYLLALATIPFWLSMWQARVGFGLE